MNFYWFLFRFYKGGKNGVKWFYLVPLTKLAEHVVIFNIIFTFKYNFLVVVIFFFFFWPNLWQNQHTSVVTYYARHFYNHKNCLISSSFFFICKCKVDLHIKANFVFSSVWWHLSEKRFLFLYNLCNFLCYVRHAEKFSRSCIIFFFFSHPLMGLMNSDWYPCWFWAYLKYFDCKTRLKYMQINRFILTSGHG